MNQLELINMARAESNGSYSDLAKRIGYNKSTVANWCSGRSNIPNPTIVALAIIAKVDPTVALAECCAEKETDPATRDAWKELARRAAILTTLGSLILSPITELPRKIGLQTQARLPIMYKLLRRKLNITRLCFFH